jgi:acyl-CoA thioester hydrolase
MLINETQLRVQYYETDQMGVVHHSNYIRYFEIGRTEMMRRIGLTYKEVEDSGTVMPIIGVEARYFFPAHYDEIICVKSFIKEMPKARMTVYYEIYNEQGKLLADGNTTLAFLNKETGRPQRAPESMINLFSQYLKNE